jgi:hypothetical protein
MLKQQFEKQNTLNLQQYVEDYSNCIQNEKEKVLLQNIIFHNIPKIKCIPYDFDWNVCKDFRVVSRAILKMTTINTELKICIFNDPMSIHIRNHMTHVLNTLKSGMYSYGCTNPPCKIACDVGCDKIMSLAQQVMGLQKVKVEEITSTECKEK